MKIIDFEQAKKRKIQEQQLNTELPIVKRLYKDGEVMKCEVSGEKEIPKTLLKKE